MSNSQQRRPIRTLIASPWKLDVRQLSEELAADGSVQISAAATPAAMDDQIHQCQPDVLLLDIDLEAGRTPQRITDLLRCHQIPIVIRADTEKAPAGLLLDCIDAGAVAIVNRPGSQATDEPVPSLAHFLRAAATASIPKLLASLSASWPSVPMVQTVQSDAILAIGCGMGSLPALCGILSQIPAGGPGTVVIAPLPSSLTAVFAARLASRCKLQVQVATDGQPIRPGQILIAPGDSHLLARRSSAGYAVAIKPGPAIFDQKPSLEMLFGSLADVAGPQTIGVLLGGSGVGGVASLLAVRNSGGSTLVQSPDSCVLTETTTRAAKCNAADAIEPADQIAARIMAFAAGRSSLRAA